MSTGLKPYPSYKDSGVEWLGDIPEHWEAVRIKWLVSKIGSGKYHPRVERKYILTEGCYSCVVKTFISMD